MQIEIRHSPSFAVARTVLGEGETIRAEAGAFMASSGAVEIDARSEGGLTKGVKRGLLGGESLFVNRLTAGPGGGWVDLAPRQPGDLTVLTVKTAVTLGRGAWVASSADLTMDAKWAGLKNLASGAGGFLTRIENSSSAPGTVLACCYGALDVVQLAPDESCVLDVGHVVAFEDGIAYETRDVHRGLVQSLKSGEALVFEFTGPGRVWTQSRNARELVSWLSSRGLKRS